MVVTFKTKLSGTPTGPTGIEIPAKVLNELAAPTKKPALKITINGKFTYTSSAGVMAGKTMIPLSAERRGQAGVKAGDPITVTLELETAERTVEVPADLAKALAAKPKAKAAFEMLAYSYRKEHVRQVEDAKKPETRVARIEKIVAALS